MGIKKRLATLVAFAGLIAAGGCSKSGTTTKEKMPIDRTTDDVLVHIFDGRVFTDKPASGLLNLNDYINSSMFATRITLNDTLVSIDSLQLGQTKLYNSETDEYDSISGAILFTLYETNYYWHAENKRSKCYIEFVIDSESEVEAYNKFGNLNLNVKFGNADYYSYKGKKYGYQFDITVTSGETKIKPNLVKTVIALK